MGQWGQRDKYPAQLRWATLQGVKDFEDFKRVTKLMENKAHLTKEGLSQIHSWRFVRIKNEF